MGSMKQRRRAGAGAHQDIGLSGSPTVLVHRNAAAENEISPGGQRLHRGGDPLVLRTSSPRCSVARCISRSSAKTEVSKALPSSTEPEPSPPGNWRLGRRDEIELHPQRTPLRYAAALARHPPDVPPGRISLPVVSPPSSSVWVLMDRSTGSTSLGQGSLGKSDGELDAGHRREITFNREVPISALLAEADLVDQVADFLFAEP